MWCRRRWFCDLLSMFHRHDVSLSSRRLRDERGGASPQPVCLVSALVRGVAVRVWGESSVHQLSCDDRLSEAVSSSQHAECIQRSLLRTTAERWRPGHGCKVVVATRKQLRVPQNNLVLKRPRVLVFQRGERRDDPSGNEAQLVDARGHRHTRIGSEVEFVSVDDSSDNAGSSTEPVFLQQTGSVESLLHRSFIEKSLGGAERTAVWWSRLWNEMMSRRTGGPSDIAGSRRWLCWSLLLK